MTALKHTFQVFLLFISIGTYGQESNSDIESILFDCLIQSYKEQGVDIKEELYELENDLIGNQSIKSPSGQSYYEFFKQVIRYSDNEALLDYQKLERIYKLKPKQFYSPDCLEKLKSFDSLTYFKSRYYQLNLAIQKASSDEITLSKIASAIIEVLGPSDFDHPYYRAITILAIAYTGNSIKDSLSSLRPYEREDFSAYPKISVVLTGKNELIVDGNIVNLQEFKSKLAEFVKRLKSNHLIEFKPDKNTTYGFYLIIHNMIFEMYSDLKDELAIEKFSKHFNELTKIQREEINKIYPIRVKE